MSTVRNVLLGLLTTSVLLAFTPCRAQVSINEVCSSNQSVIDDEDGDSSDWIELYNRSAESINLTGYFLTDNRKDTTKWMFESGTIAPNQHLIVFASDKNRPNGDPLHTSFKISKDGETLWLFDPAKTLIDSLVVPFVASDYSYGVYPDGSKNHLFFTSPTPSSANSEEGSKDHIIAFTPQLSLATGLYQESQNLSISSRDSSAEIRYTLDGSTPSQSSLLYTSPIQITDNTTLVAKGFMSDLLPSRSATGNYLFQDSQHLPIICLSTDPGYFFDPDTGIYVFGPNASPDFPYLGANFWSDTEVPVRMQWIDKNSRIALDQIVGARIHGGSVSRTQPMRSMRILADDSYGEDVIDFPLFENKYQPENKRFILRNSGSDFLKTELRDGIVHNLLIEDHLHVDAVSYRPVEVYLNGAFWGIHNVREKVDRFYLRYNHGVDPDNVDILEEQDQIMEGDFVTFEQMEAMVHGLDLTEDANFEVADSLFDVKNMADYFICQTFLNNLDWPYNNLKFWREKEAGAKWRYIIFDLDAVLGGVSFGPVHLDNLARVLGSFGDDNRHVLLFRKLIENPTFFNYFINRYCDLLNTTFSPERFVKHLETEAAVIEPLIEKHFNRWNGEVQNWYDEIDIARNYIIERPPYATQQLQNFFGLSKQASLNLNVYPPQAGKIELNSLSLRKFPFAGIYFEDIPISVNVTAHAGFQFSHWESNRTDINSASTHHEFHPTDGDSLTAVFVGQSTFIPFEVFPNPAAESVYATVVLDRKQPVEISLVDLNGQTEHLLFSDQLLAGSHKVFLPLPQNLNGVYLLTLQTRTQRYSQKLAILRED